MRGEIVVVEHTFAEPTTIEAAQTLEDRHAWCLETRQVKFLRTFLSRDGRRMVCVFEAPDAEAVRQVHQIAGMPNNAVWTATEYVK